VPFPIFFPAKLNSFFATKHHGPLTPGRWTDEGVRPYTIHSVSRAVFLQPVQLFADFYFAVPGIFVEAVAFAGEDQ